VLMTVLTSVLMNALASVLIDDCVLMSALMSVLGLCR
jgi:hypothetical protein